MADTMALLAALALFAALLFLLAPAFAAWAGFRRLRASTPVPIPSAQRRVDLAILLLAALTPLLGLDLFIVRRHPNGPLTLAALGLTLLCGLASLTLAALGRGPGRRPVLAAYAFFTAAALAFLLWATLAGHARHGQPFFSQQNPASGTSPRTASKHSPFPT